MKLKTEVMMLKIQRCMTGINYILKNITMENSYLKFYEYFTIYIFFLYFRSNKCSLDEHKRPLSKISHDPKPLNISVSLIIFTHDY